MRKVSRFILPALLICILILLTAVFALVFGRMDNKVEAQGMVVPARQFGLSPEISGIIKELRVREGEQVEAGDTILILASEDLEYQLERARLALAEANVHLTQVEEEYMNLTVSESFEGSAVLGDINAARKTMELSKVNFARMEKLWKSNLLSEEEKDVARYSYEVALSNYQVLEARKRMLEKQYLRQIEQRRSAVALAERALELAQRRLEKSVVKSPASGTVLTSDTDKLIGTLAAEGQPVVQIGDLSRMEFVASLRESDISDVQIGQDSRIYLNAFPHREYKVFRGKVVEIASAPKITVAGVVFETRMSIDEPWVESSNSRIDLRPGLSGRAEIIFEFDVRIIEIILDGIAK